MNILIAGIFGGTISYIFDKKGGHWRDLPKENHTKLLTKIVKLELKINEKLKQDNEERNIQEDKNQQRQIVTKWKEYTNRRQIQLIKELQKLKIDQLRDTDNNIINILKNAHWNIDQCISNIKNYVDFYNYDFNQILESQVFQKLWNILLNFSLLDLVILIYDIRNDIIYKQKQMSTKIIEQSTFLEDINFSLLNVDLRQLMNDIHKLNSSYISK